ncbi:unnamed protein product [Anisakis simplex]|uniref:Cathepsin F (inferred by orthology to a S. mansoni protein) n=1 Tax=Anisakis simplex TaxID=6269 RepID=A0A0M3KGL7_ANISI|nr:unnamed protein product [Anisakis simplex]
MFFRFNRDYDSVEEMVKRFAHFVGSDMAIMDLQKFSDGTIYGLTGLADKALDERGDGKEDCRDGRMLLDNMDLDWAVIDPREHPDESMPSSFDWRTKRAVTDVKDQGECRNSWVFSSIAVVESMNAIENGVLQPLSEQNVIDCELPYDRCETRTPRMALR